MTSEQNQRLSGVFITGQERELQAPARTQLGSLIRLIMLSIDLHFSVISTLRRYYSWPVNEKRVSTLFKKIAAD